MEVEKYKDLVGRLKDSEAKTNYVSTLFNVCAFIYFVTGIDKLFIILDFAVAPVLTAILDILRDDSFIGRLLLSITLALLVDSAWKLHNLTLKVLKISKNIHKLVVYNVCDFVIGLPLLEEKLASDEVETYKDYIKVLHEFMKSTCKMYEELKEILYIPESVINDIKDAIYNRYELTKCDKVLIEDHLEELIIGGIQ